MESGKNITDTFRKEVKVSEWAFDRIKEVSRMWQKMKQKKAGHHPRNHDKKHWLLATDHRASGEARRRCDVIFVPVL